MATTTRPSTATSAAPMAAYRQAGGIRVDVSCPLRTMYLCHFVRFLERLPDAVARVPRSPDAGAHGAGPPRASLRERRAWSGPAPATGAGGSAPDQRQGRTERPRQGRRRPRSGTREPTRRRWSSITDSDRAFRRPTFRANACDVKAVTDTSCGVPVRLGANVNER